MSHPNSQFNATLNHALGMNSDLNNIRLKLNKAKKRLIPLKSTVYIFMYY